MMPEDTALLTRPDNIIWGVCRDIMVETDKDIRSQVYIIVLTLRAGLVLEEPDRRRRSCGRRRWRLSTGSYKLYAEGQLAFLRRKLTVEIDFVELVSEAFQLEGGSGPVHHLYRTGEYVERLHGLMFNLFMLDECCGFLGAA